MATDRDVNVPELHRYQLAGRAISAEHSLQWHVLLLQILSVLLPIGAEIGNGIETFNQRLIPRLKLVQDVALFEELNAAYCLRLPGFDGLIIEGRTCTSREVRLK